MSEFDQYQYRTGSEPRHRRMARYDDAEAPVTPAKPDPASPAGGDTTRAPRVYDGYQETSAAPRAGRSANDTLLEQRSRAFEKQPQHTGVYTRMTQTGYHQTIRQPQRAEYETAAPDAADVYTARGRDYDEYQAPAPDIVRREGYERPVGRTNQRPAAREELPQDQRRRTPPPTVPPQDGGDDEEDGERFPLFAKIILIVVLALILLVAGLYFLLPEGNSGIIGSLNNLKSGIESTVTRFTGLIRPTEEPAQVKSLTVGNPSGNVGDKCLFNVTTSLNVTGVALTDMDGGRITSSITRSLNDDSQRIWELTVIFDKPYSGDIFASIQQGDNVWVTSDKYVTVSYTSPQPTPAPTVIVQTLDIEDEPTPAPEGTAEAPTPGPPFSMVTPYMVTPYVVQTSAPKDEPNDEPADEPVDEPEPNDEPTGGDDVTEPEPVDEPTGEPVETAEPTATPEPTPTPRPTATPQPTPTPLPALTASSDASKVPMTESAMIDAKAQKNYERQTPLQAPHPDNYTWWDAGVLTFRGDNFRRNAAFGTVEVSAGQMSVLWKKELGHLATADSGTVYGIGWTGQPAIVKWSKEVRSIMNLNAEKKNVSALREVIFSAQDGKVYFLDLTDGEETRAPINVGFPLKGSVSVSTRGYPIVGFGQGISKLKNKSGKIGYYLYNLVDQSELYFINGRQTEKQSQYATNGAFDGTDLFLWNSNHLLVAGENGLLYTIDLNVDFQIDGTLTVDPQTVYLKSKAQKAPEKRVGIESSIAMYNQYVFMVDSYGALRCVDTSTMKTIWAFDTGDNTDAAVALDFDASGTLWLYTGNTNSYRLGKKNVSIRRLNAMTGEQDWAYEIACAQDNKTELSGCKASPVVGENSIQDLVVFTVNMLKEGGSKVVALEKATGEVRWEYAMSANAISSPVAVYNGAGDAWIIQGDQDGVLHLLDGRSGARVSDLQLEGKIEGSPAVYKDTLVIGTGSRDGAYMYGIKIE